MIRTKWYQVTVTVVLCLTVMVATEVTFPMVRSESSHVPRLPRPASTMSTRCFQGLDMRKISCANKGLRAVPENLYPGVEKLDLSFNYIKSLLNSSFSSYHRLKWVSLHFNFIEQIAPGTFYSTPMLEFLDLGNNWFLRSITPKMFKFCTKLSHLVLSSTSLDFLCTDALRWLPKLQMLDLSETDMSHINLTFCNSETYKLKINLWRSNITEITPKTFRIDCELHSLILEVIGFSAIDPQTIAMIRSRSLSFGNNMTEELWKSFFIGIGNSAVEELLLKTSNVGMIDQRYFAPLQKKSLRVLDLSDNDNLSNLSGMGFLDLPLLYSLILDRCGIDYIDAIYFTRMKGLRVLHLNFNKIRYFGTSNSFWNIGLQELYLSHNSISSTDVTTFTGLTNLTKLVLRGNADLQYLTIMTFTGLENLKYIDLSGCYLIVQLSIMHLSLEVFNYSDCEEPEYLTIIKDIFENTEIRHVFMANASLSALWVEEYGHRYSLFQGMRNLSSLVARQNPLKLLRAGLFADLWFLTELDLSDCQLELIENSTFEGLQHLKILRLQNNQLQNLPPGVLQKAGRLDTINLDGNQLRYLDRDLFVNTSKLRNLTISGNRLSGFNQSTFEPILNSLVYIDVSENELGCICKLKWLPLWLAGSVTLLNETSTRCSFASLEELREKPLMSFKPAEFCGPNLALYCSLPFAAMCVAVIIFLAYRHRWLLKYKLFLLKLAVIGYQEIQDVRELDDFEFHFNVMFAEEDDEWVRDHLRPVLEDQLPEYNRNVYGDNYLPLGMHYCDAVHYVVEKSYKTIMVISRAAIQDNWFVIKFRAAADQVIDTQLENMVVIFVEDIPDDELPFLVRLYLSDRKPYLSWEHDERYQEYFWQQVIKMLKINLRGNNRIPPE